MTDIVDFDGGWRTTVTDASNNWTNRHPGEGVIDPCGHSWVARHLNPDGSSDGVVQRCVLERGHTADGIYHTSSGKVQERRRRD